MPTSSAATLQRPPVNVGSSQSSEVEQLKADLARKEQELAESRKLVARERSARDAQEIDYAVYQAAQGRFVSPNAAPRLIDRARVIVDRRTGKPDPGSVRDAIDALLREYPDLAGAQQGGGSPGAHQARRPAPSPRPWSANLQPRQFLVEPM